jgi:hypothetical protein
MCRVLNGAIYAGLFQFVFALGFVVYENNKLKTTVDKIEIVMVNGAIGMGGGGGSRAVGGAVLNYVSRKEVVGSKVNRGSFMMSNNLKKKTTKTIIITSG